MFRKLLIANRGEIACRIAATARRMGIATVAVFSEADRLARHVEMADEAVSIGPAPARESYLDIGRILDACRVSGAEAVHPGYGFLAEDPRFAAAVEAAGLAFVGPSSSAIAAMGDKIASKRLARGAGVSVVPGEDRPVDSADEALAIARSIGYPVMVKASAGGGGKGIRIARSDGEMADALEACRAEAAASFGDDRVFLEKYVENPHHVEIQILADAHGNVVHLGERECSIQRRHQKVLEEAPSPFLDVASRRAMADQAVALARAVGYRSAGTVEFVVGADRSFYFLEMNTRLQVEHPVTEMTTGLDLVELMIRVAAGEPLPFRQEDVRRDGWAIECRVNAEDPSRNFLPAVGRIVRYRPPSGPGVRVDSGVDEGGNISIHYDSMIAKVIAHGKDRAEAIARLRDALDGFVIRGLATNLEFQAALVGHPEFVAGGFDTGFLAAHFPEGHRAEAAEPDDPTKVAAIAAFADRKARERDWRGAAPPRDPGDDRVVLWRGRATALRLAMADDGCTIEHEGKIQALRSDWRPGDPTFRGTWDGEPFRAQVERAGPAWRVVHRGARVDALVLSPRGAELAALMPLKAPPDLSRFLLAPMPGLLVELLVDEGRRVHQGEPLATVEAMKMRNVLRASADATVAEVLARPGDSLAVDQPILRFEA